MTNNLWKFRVAVPWLTGIVAIASSLCSGGGVPQAIAADLEDSASTPLVTIPSETEAINAEIDPVFVMNEEGNSEPDAGMAQVTSVSQLTDVQPTDWAFQALQSLVERYGVIAGYPDGTFRGNRAMTRYEFAAGLNAALDRINQLVAAGTAGLVNQEDLGTLQKLQEEFSAELATLRGRVDTLEARTAELEANQFSTTTKLSGLVWFNATGAFASGDVKAETNNLAGALGRLELRQAVRDAAGRPIVSQVTEDPSITFSDLGWLTLETSFTGRDTLVTQLAFGNGESPANVFTSAGLFNTFGTPFLDQTAGIQGAGNQVLLRELFYSFPVTDAVQLVLGPRINWYRYFDYNRFNFFFNSNYSFNSLGGSLLNTLDRGSGAAALVQLGQQLQLNVAYLGENTEFLPAGPFNSSSDPSRGLFGGTWTATAELTYSPSSAFNVRLLYNRSRIEARGGQIGGVQGEPLQNGIADAGPGFSTVVDAAGFVVNGGLNDSTADTFSINFDWLITQGLGIFGRYSYGSTHLNPIGRDVNIQALQVGLGFPDLGRPGAMGVLSASIPFDVVEGEEFLVSGYGDGGTQIDIEASYFFPVTANIALVPAFYAIINPNNFSDNPTIFVGSLRTQFSF